MPPLPSFAKFQFTIVITSPTWTPPVVACAIVRNGIYSTPKIAPTTGEDGRPGFTLSDERSNKWTGSAEDTTGSYAGIAVGDCLEFPTSIAAAKELSCDQPHAAEMFVLDAGLGIDDLNAAYPAEDEWSHIATPICEDRFVEYTAIPLADAAGLSYTFIYP